MKTVSLLFILYTCAGFSQHCGYDMVIYPDQNRAQKVERYDSYAYYHHEDTTGASKNPGVHCRPLEDDKITIATGCGFKLIVLVLQSGNEFMRIFFHNVPSDYSTEIRYLPFIAGDFHFDIKKFLSENEYACTDCRDKQKPGESSLSMYCYNTDEKGYKVVYCPFLF